MVDFREPRREERKMGHSSFSQSIWYLYFSNFILYLFVATFNVELSGTYLK